ncbi:hypothetical protein AB5J55_14795 [Streptomyces sp. R11]|uniref:Uncharacterized protein n=1 Tax=Streptomyces sp. R11 TaxID=3238625 RepID=A0AB39MWP7_9ACTN
MTCCEVVTVVQIEQAEHGHQEQEQAVPEQRAGGTWLSRFRS